MKSIPGFVIVDREGCLPKHTRFTFFRDASGAVGSAKDFAKVYGYDEVGITQAVLVVSPKLEGKVKP